MSRYYYFSLINESLMATQKPQILAGIDKRFLSAQQNGHKEKKKVAGWLDWTKNICTKAKYNYSKPPASS